MIKFQSSREQKNKNKKKSRKWKRWRLMEKERGLIRTKLLLSIKNKEKENSKRAL